MHKYVDSLMEMVIQDQIQLNDIITHRLPLTEAPHAYEIFNDKKDNCVKVILNP